MSGLDAIDRLIVNSLQGGFPISAHPYAEAAERLGLSEAELIARLSRLVETGVASRFGPLWNSEELGGAVCLAAMAIPAERFDAVTGIVNAHPEIAHNYARDHALNMWFVVSAEKPERIDAVMAEITQETGIKVWPMPKEEEYFVGFRVEV